MRYLTLFTGVFILSLAVGYKITAVDGWLTLGALLLVIGGIQCIANELTDSHR